MRTFATNSVAAGRQAFTTFRGKLRTEAPVVYPFNGLGGVPFAPAADEERRTDAANDANAVIRKSPRGARQLGFQ